MTARHGIAVAGSILVDRIYEISAYPQEGELTKINKITRAVGGCVPNVAIDLKKIVPALEISAIGKLGTDDDGTFVREVLEASGVRCDGLISAKKFATGFTDVMSVVGGQRTFFTHCGANSDFGIADIDFEKLDSRMLHLGYFLLLDRIDRGDGVNILKEATSRGIKTSIDLVSENSDRYSSVIPCLPYTDNLIINEIEAAGITGISPERENLPKIAHALRDMGVKERVIIHTAELGICLSERGLTTLPSFKLPDGYIKGTTGAGDAFCAGALIGIYEDLSDLELLRLASTAAAASLGAPDATSGLATKEEMIKFAKALERR